MKYTNTLTKQLLIEFRKFQKYAPKEIYSFRGDQQEAFNNRIEEIVRHHKILNKEVEK